MLTKTVTYTDFDGNERTEDIRFNFTKEELVRLNLSKEGGLEYYLNKLIQTRNTKEVAAILREVLLLAYGEKSADGKRFVKSEEISKNFADSAMFSDIYMELVNDPDKCADFFKKVIPQEK